jgi:hypothetical protein
MLTKLTAAIVAGCALIGQARSVRGQARLPHPRHVR